MQSINVRGFRSVNSILSMNTTLIFILFLVTAIVFLSTFESILMFNYYHQVTSAVQLMHCLPRFDKIIFTCWPSVNLYDDTAL